MKEYYKNTRKRGEMRGYSMWVMANYDAMLPVFKIHLDLEALGSYLSYPGKTSSSILIVIIQLLLINPFSFVILFKPSKNHPDRPNAIYKLLMDREVGCKPISLEVNKKVIIKYLKLFPIIHILYLIVYLL